MGIKVKLTFFTPQVVKAMKDGAARQMAEAVNEVRNETLKTLSGSRKADPSRMYFVPGTKKLYQASSPGEPPAAPTGALRQSIKTEIEHKLGVIVGSVGTRLKKGKRLEFGDRRLKPRPWLRISFLKAEGKIKDILGGRWFR